ncbi:hypothetical protein [Polyangium sp. 6x1]|uniref:hypothetical protein n=1 Tax=Polyangium sp. 6x1 TaxID=3042689 RepID=UPI002482FD7B|nr:hypothetical protein [Polyangium sp. 6x1]MDI1443992.1 hypothetical protein [Polyangium sp. 6x1]
MNTNRAFVAAAVLMAWGALAACSSSDTIEQRTGPGGAQDEATTTSGDSVGAATVGPGGAGGIGGAGGATPGSGAGGAGGEGGSGSGGVAAGGGGSGGVAAGGSGGEGAGGSGSGSGSGGGGGGGSVAAGGSGGDGGSGGLAAGGNGGAGGIDPTGGGGFGSASAGCSGEFDCNDGIDCTVDACVAGECKHGPDSNKCSDGKYCNGVEVCDPKFGCVDTSDPCDDGIDCTVDACDEAIDACTYTPHDALCDNKITCDGVETCHPILGCLSSAPLDCNDGLPCTDDYCDLLADACKHHPNDGKCADGLFCDGVETCDPILGCQAGTPVDCNDGVACTADACNEATDSCDAVPEHASCDDGVYCNGKETCGAGGCIAGNPIICDDNLSCTSDACSEAEGGCIFTAVNAACNDGLYCNGVETCSTAGPAPSGCVPGTSISCPADSVACTLEACDEAILGCKSTADNAACAAGELCIPGAGGCTTAMPCVTAADCDDGDACNGTETCDVVCKAGTPVSCNDGIACTIDSCVSMTGACIHTPNHDVCNDGWACNGVETCDPGLGCALGTPVICDDGIACTYDLCHDPGGTCAHYAQDYMCDDDVFCDGAEVCDPFQGCIEGEPVTCSDGIACTADVCDEVLDTCKGIPDDSLCPCNQTCDAEQGGCGNFCKVTTCQGKVYACGDCVDNDGDCKTDSADDQCLGPCDNTEDSFYGGIPGQNNSPCKSDCYFDADTGSGNDACYWSHKCDPLSVAPSYPPEGSQCAYNPNASIPGYSGTCSMAAQTQSALCDTYCGPLTPNGCDCFGCCLLPWVDHAVWLGSENPSGTGSCTLDNVDDPSKCKPCTQVQACDNPCETCEICIGKPNLPPECAEQQCAPGADKCGLPGQPSCPDGHTCITGCCAPIPQ